VGAIDLATMQDANMMADRSQDKWTPVEIAKMLDAKISRH
jgi:hypothetical protein